MKIRKGDTIEVITGKERGKRGTVLHVSAADNSVTVEKINLVTKHVKAKSGGQKGERIHKEAPMDLSNVMLVDPHSEKKTRVGYAMEGDKKVRIAKVSGKAL
jgi:large subunit ribosomal protein L24